MSSNDSAEDPIEHSITARGKKEDGFDPGTTPTAPDPFDPDRLRLDNSTHATLGVKRVLTEIPIKKPGKEQWVRTHPSAEYRFATLVLEQRDDFGETYLIAPEIRDALMTEPAVAVRQLVASVTRQGVPFIWPIRLPDVSGRQDAWSRSALEAADRARTRWVRVAADKALNAYAIWEAKGNFPDPEWPDLPFREWLRIAFRDRYIMGLDHPILRELRGEA